MGENGAYLEKHSLKTREKFSKQSIARKFASFEAFPIY